MIWQCQACGKQAEDRAGMEGWHSPGWDESCMLNAKLVSREERQDDQGAEQDTGGHPQGS